MSEFSRVSRVEGIHLNDVGYVKKAVFDTLNGKLFLINYNSLSVKMFVYLKFDDDNRTACAGFYDDKKQPHLSYVVALCGC